MGTSLGMSEIPLTVNEAVLLAMFLLIEGQLLPFDAGKCVLMGMEAGDVGNDTGILELDKCIVNDETG